MTPLIDALRSKYRSPQAAMRALGLDEALLRDGVPMKLDAPLAKAAKAGLKELLAQDASLMDVMEFIDALKSANPEGGEQQGAPQGVPPEGEPPEETDEQEDREEPTKDAQMTTAPNGGLPMPGGGKRKAYDNDMPMEEAGMATDNPAAKLHALLSEHCPPEVMAQIGEILGQISGEAEEGEHEVNEAEAAEGEDEKPDEVRQEEKKEMKAAMDAAIGAAITAERENSRAILDALRDVRPVVGELAMAFDSPCDVYRQACKMRGVDAAKIDKIKDPEALRLVWNNLPKPSASAPRTSVAMDAAAIDSYHKLFPSAARLGRI